MIYNIITHIDTNGNVKFIHKNKEDKIKLIIYKSNSYNRKIE